MNFTGQKTTAYLHTHTRVSHLYEDETWDDGVAAQGVVGRHLASCRETSSPPSGFRADHSANRGTSSVSAHSLILIQML